jgi:hypothetical protein
LISWKITKIRLNLSKIMLVSSCLIFLRPRINLYHSLRSLSHLWITGLMKQIKSKTTRCIITLNLTLENYGSLQKNLKITFNWTIKDTKSELLILEFIMRKSLSQWNRPLHTSLRPKILLSIRSSLIIDCFKRDVRWELMNMNLPLSVKARA